MANHRVREFIGGIGISRHLCMDVDHDGLCDRCGKEVRQLDRSEPVIQPGMLMALPLKHYWGDDSNPGFAVASKVWKIECSGCNTNWVYGEADDTLPDECENCGLGIVFGTVELPST